jgi:hypothetical protein
MKQLNTFPVEDFLEKARIAIKTNQRSLTLSIKEVTDLHASLAAVMTRLSGQLDHLSGQNSVIEIKMDGGKFQ